MGIIVHLGSNYVGVQLDENKTVRKWLDDVQKVNISQDDLPKNLKGAMESRIRRYK